MRRHNESACRALPDASGRKSGVLRLAGSSRLLRAWRGGGLADLDEVAVGVADVCADLAAVVFGLGEELGSSGRPDLRCRGDVRDADVEEGADLVGVGRRCEGDRGFVVGRAAAVVEDERRVRYLQDDWIALAQDFPAEHGLVEVTGAVLVGDHEKEGDEEVPLSPGVLVLAHLFPFLVGHGAGAVGCGHCGGAGSAGMAGAGGWAPARSARRTRITARLMIRVSSAIPAATRNPRANPVARAWL